MVHGYVCNPALVEADYKLTANSDYIGVSEIRDIPGQ